MLCRGRSVSHSLRVTVDATKVSPSPTICSLAGLASLAIVTRRMLIELADGMGSQEAAGQFLLEIVEQIGRSCWTGRWRRGRVDRGALGVSDLELRRHAQGRHPHDRR